MSGKTIASLTATVGADVAGFERGMSTVKSSLTDVKNQMTSTGGTMFTASGALSGWTKANYAAADAGGKLVDKAVSLQRAVESGSMSAAQATKEYRAYEAQMKSGVWQQMNFGEKAQVVRQRLQEVQAQMLKFGAAGAGVLYAGKQVYDFAKSGAELEYTQTRFERLTKSVGGVSSVFMNQLKVATKGTVSDMGLAKQAADMFQLGLAGSTEEAVRLSRVQTALGMDTGELTLALANQSKRRLDQLGLSLTKFNEIESKLKASGMSSSAAFKEAFLQTAEQTVLTTGNKADSNIGNFQRLEAGGANFMNALKMSAPNMNMGWMFGGDSMSQTANKVSMFLNGMSDLMQGNTVLDMSGGLGASSWVRQAGAQDKSSLWANGGRNTTVSNFGRGGSRVDEQAITGLSALQNYTAMAYKYSSQANGGLGAPTPEAAPPPDYQTMISGGIQLTNVNKEYTSALAELNVQLAEQNAQMNKYAKYGETSKKYMEAKQNADALKESIGQLEAAQDQQANQFMLASMMADEAFDPAKAYDFAAASGLITKQAAEQQKGFLKVKDALAAGTLSAQDAADAVKAISGDVRALNGMSASAYIDLYITEHGSVPPGFSTATVTKENHRGGGLGGYGGAAGGGQLDGKGWTLTGDLPGGMLTPYSELISPTGRIIDAKTTNWLIKNKIIGDYDSRYIGSQDVLHVADTSARSARTAGSRGGGFYYAPMSNNMEGRSTSQSEMSVVQQNLTSVADTLKQIQQNAATQRTELTASTIRDIGKSVAKEVSLLVG